ncbi:hypothetical protein ASF74_05425 [Arthrobacter sp. Leaf145]|nr:hypothetical protein ASF74_05425 [Arthrobacter sp. Leaf145]
MAAWQRVTLSWLVAWRVRKATKDLKLPVPSYWGLRRYLSGAEPLAALRSGEPVQIERLAQSIRSQPFGDSWPISTDQSSQFVALLLSAYTQRLSISDAIEIQSSITRAEIKSAELPSLSVFEMDLQRIAPIRAKQAMTLLTSWPPILRFVHEFVSTEDPPSALEDWSQSPPNWFGQVNADALMWMSEVASDYGLTSVAASLMSEGLRQGATPAKYWKIRRELLRGGPSRTLQRESMSQYGGHPLADAIVAALDDDPLRALDILQSWDTREPSAAALKISMQCQFLAAMDDVDGAVRLAREALARQEVTGPALLAAEYLLRRGSLRESRLHFSDLENSLDLALQVRDKIRLWKGPSHRAVSTAIQAAQVLGNAQKAWELSQMPPDGEATAHEANQPQIRQQALVIAAEIRTEDEVLPLLSNEKDPLTRLEVQALMAEHRGDSDSALDFWSQASDLATKAIDQFRIGLHLAMHGTLSSKLDALAVIHEDLIEDIRLTVDAFNGLPGQFEALRTRARQRRTLAFALYKFLDSRGDHAQAASVAALAAEQWSDAELWFTAAYAYLRAIDTKSAVDCARKALAAASPHWGKREAVWRLLIETLSADGRWVEAADAAAQLMSVNPHDPSAVWVLTECQMRLGQLDEAWKTFADFGGKPSPRNDHEAVLRIELWRRNQSAGAALDQLLEVLDAFPESKQVRAMTTRVLMQQPEDLPASVSSKIEQTIIEQLPSLEDVFVPKSVDLENPMATLDALVADMPETSDVDRQVDEGELPFGFAASVHHRNYVELLACRTGTVFSGDATEFKREASIATMARNAEVVVDVTTFLTLGLFDQDVSDQLLGYVGVPVTPLEQLLDAIHAVDSLSQRSTMSVGRSSAGTAQIHTISEHEADQRYTRALQVQARLQGTKSQSRNALTNIPSAEIDGQVFVWLASLDLALDEPQRKLWCDDAKVRQLATSLGIESFGTSALVESMRLQGDLSDELATTLQAVLINHHHVGAPFRREWLEAAASLDGWRSTGVASYIAWAPLIADPEELIRFVLEGLRRTTNDPDSILGWVQAAARWLIRIGADEAYSNLVLFLQRLLDQTWVTGDRLPFVLAGVRTAAMAAQIADPFEEALKRHYQGLTQTAGPELASQHVRSLVQQANADDRTLTHRIILTTY